MQRVLEKATKISMVVTGSVNSEHVKAKPNETHTHAHTTGVRTSTGLGGSGDGGPTTRITPAPIRSEKYDNA